MRIMLLAALRRCIAVAVLLLLSVGSAATQEKAGIQWTRLPGNAIDLSINADGQAYAIGKDGTPWRWDSVEQRWRRMSGNFRRISAAEGNRPWVVDAEGAVLRYNGLWWEKKDTGVVDVAADTRGNVFIAKADGSILKWYSLRSEWQPFDGVARRITIDAAGQPWVITPDGGIRSFDGTVWADRAGRATDIAFGGADTIAIADGEGRLRLRRTGSRKWEVVPGIAEVVAVAVTPDGGPWAVTREGAVMATTLLVSETQQEEAEAPEPKAPDAVAAPISVPVETASVPSPPPVVAPPVIAPTPTAEARPRDRGRPVLDIDPAAITTSEDITFVDTRATAKSIAIGKDGSVFALDGAGAVFRWSNARQRFESFPGELVRIAVDPFGNPWGISALGRVFRHDGRLWRQIANATASDIAVGSDGTVIIADASGTLSRLNEAGTRFDRIAGQGLLVAVAPDGSPWTIRSDGLVQHCAKSPCTVLKRKAKAISVGPDGRVWIVSDRDLLMRLKADQSEFELVRVPGRVPAKVAAGPMGFPWVVSADDHVLASHYFERDESGDRAVAAGTTGDTTGSGATAPVVSNEVAGFTFSKNMRFETIGTDIFSSGSYLRLAAGRDDKIYAGSQTTLGVFNTQTKRFVALDSKITANQTYLQDFAVTSDGDIWAYVDQFQDYKLVRERNGTVTTFSVAGHDIDGVEVAPDDTVYAVFNQQGTSSYYLYVKAANAQSFTKFSSDSNIYDVGVGTGNDVWIVDRSNYVQQWNGTRFVRRPASGQKANKIAVGSDGTVYILDTNDSLRKWNGLNQSFDAVNNTTGYYLAVDEDGRPWINTDSTPIVKRARD